MRTNGVLGVTLTSNATLNDSFVFPRGGEYEVRIQGRGRSRGRRTAKAGGSS